MSELYKISELYYIDKIEETNEMFIKEINNELKIIRHDLIHDYRLLQHYLKEKEYDNLDNILNAKLKQISEIPSYYYTKNKMLNMIINHKVIKASSNKLKLIANIQVDENLSINDFELYELLSNILNNAIENCSKNGNILINVIQENSYLYIKVENDINQISDLKTLKNPKYHGYGLKSIQSIIKNYNGKFNIEQENNKFIIKVSLYLD